MPRSIAVVATALSALALAACGSSSSGTTMHARMAPIVRGGPGGTVTLNQKGTQLTASWKLHGLTPGAHAYHVHGPAGACQPAKKRTAGMAVVLPDAVADRAGDAVGSATVTVHENVLAKGFYVQVHRDGTPGQFRSLQRSGTEVSGGTMSGPMSGLMRAMDSDPGIGCAGL